MPAIATNSSPSPVAPQLVTTQDVINRIGHSRTVTLTAYVLSPNGMMTTALADAAGRGTRVNVELASNAFGFAKGLNERSGAVLKNAGAGVRLSSGPLHLKVALVDHSMYLADTNWTRDSIVFHDDDEADRSLVARTLLGRPGCNGTLCTEKRLALREEARFVASCHGPLILESESFNSTSPIFDAVLRYARTGAQTRLIFARQEASISAAALTALEHANVQIRTSSRGDKLAVCNGKAYVGSANATPGLGNMVDWSYVTSSPSVVQTLRGRAETNWAGASNDS